MNRIVLAWGYAALFQAGLLGQSRPADALVKTAILIGFGFAAAMSVASFKPTK